MSKGYAIVFGLNNVDPVHYDGWDGALGQPENDASVIYQIASGNGLESKIFQGNDVTRDNVIGSIRRLPGNLLKEISSLSIIPDMVVSYRIWTEMKRMGWMKPGVCMTAN